jgi:hypothetical protein
VWSPPPYPDARQALAQQEPNGVFSLKRAVLKGTISVQVRSSATRSARHFARVRKYLELAEHEWDGGPESLTPLAGT